MSNHVHMLITPQDETGVSVMMQSLGRRYVRYVNQRYQRRGTLWEGRYKANLVDSETHLLNCMRYIELNPVRARLVTYPVEYQWSSYLTNAVGVFDPLIQLHPRYLRLGTTEEERYACYYGLFLLPLDDSVVNEIRRSLNKELVMGSRDFKLEIETLTHRRTEPRRAGRPCIEEQEGEYYF